MSESQNNDKSADHVDVVKEKFVDVLVPGFEVEMTPDEAEQAGAFEEDALSEADAKESQVDLNHPAA